jgi:hypothetical protein
MLPQCLSPLAAFAAPLHSSCWWTRSYWWTLRRRMSELLSRSGWTGATKKTLYQVCEEGGDGSRFGV